MKYFARQILVHDYPHTGELCWCVVDSKGGFFVVKDQTTAETEATRRNAQMDEQDAAEGAWERLQMGAGWA